MSKELTNISDSVMGQIREGKAKMHSRAYFILGSFLVFFGVVASLLASVFLVGLFRFSIRHHGPMGEYRMDQLIDSFPWWAIVIALVGLGVGIVLIRAYDFSYKFKFQYIVVGFVLAVISAGILLDMTGINDTWMRRGPMRGVMQKYIHEENGTPIEGQHRGMGNRRAIP